MTYAGLPHGTISYLRELAADNSRAWFAAQRADHDRFWLAAGLDLSAALSAPAKGPGLHAVPKENAGLRRIHRDVRFAADKRPYEPRLHMVLSSGSGAGGGAGVHLVVGPAGIGYGAGSYGMTPAALDTFRRRVCDGAGRAGLEAALAVARGVGAVLDAPDLKRVPRGYDPAPWDHLIRRKSVIVRRDGDVGLPDWLHGPGAVTGWMAIVGALVPLVRWLQPITAA